MFHFILPTKIILLYDKVKNRVGSSNYKTNRCYNVQLWWKKHRICRNGSAYLTARILQCWKIFLKVLHFILCIMRTPQYCMTTGPSRTADDNRQLTMGINFLHRTTENIFAPWKCTEKKSMPMGHLIKIAKQFYNNKV